MGRIALVLLLLCAACQRKLPPVAAPALPASPAQAPQAQLEKWRDAQDPRHEWLRSLQELPLTQLPAPKWSCVRNRGWLQVDTQALGVACEALLRANLEHVGESTPYCSGSHELQLHAQDGDCNASASTWPSALSRWRMPREAGYFLAESETRLLPNRARHPALLSLLPLQLEGKAPYTLVSPHWTTWLANAQERGALHLALLPIGTETHSEAWLNGLQQLNAFISSLRSPRRLKVTQSLQGMPPQKNSKALPAARLGTLDISHNYQDPLLAEPCRYLQAWLQARLLADGSGVKSNAPRLNLRFECRYVWNHNLGKHPFLSVARLPVPLALDHERMPFVSVEDSLSPSQLLLALGDHASNR